MSLHIFDQPGLTVKRERERENNVKTWDATNSMAGLQMNTHTKSTHITQGSFPVTTQYMSEMHKRQTDMVIIFVRMFARSQILKHISGNIRFLDSTLMSVW